MFINKLLNTDSAPVLERLANFTADRHKVLAEDIANIDTPNYRQKDLSLASFQQAMQERIDNRDRVAGSEDFSGTEPAVTEPNEGILFHDGNNRSPEQLMSEFAKNALMHNMAIEMLRKQYSMMEMALRERVT